MSHHKLMSALGLSAAMLLGGNAFAQAGVGNPRTMPPDTTAPAAPAQRMEPSAGTSTDIKGQTQSGDSGAAYADGQSTPSHKKHSRKKSQPQPKPADNDNNAMPNTVSPSSSPSPQ